MAFATFRDNLQKVAGNPGNGPSIFAYKTTDTLATVDGAGYFNTAGGILKLGDLIFVHVVTNIDASNEAYAASGLMVVNAKTGPTAGAYTINCTNALATGTIDSD